MGPIAPWLVGESPVYEWCLEWCLGYVAPTVGLLMVVLSTAGQVNATTGTALRNKWYFVVESRIWIGIYLGLAVIGGIFFAAWSYYMAGPRPGPTEGSGLQTHPSFRYECGTFCQRTFFFSMIGLVMGLLASVYMLFFYDIDIFRSWIEDELRIEAGRLQKPEYCIRIIINRSVILTKYVWVICVGVYLCAVSTINKTLYF